jgi:hypothetical protein
MLSRSKHRSELTDVAPNRSGVKRIILPHDRVHELVQKSDAHPNHVAAYSSVDMPHLEMPWEGVKDHEKT